MSLGLQSFILKSPGKGGVNEKVDAESVRDDQSTPPDASTLALKNCHTDMLGRIVKRKGYTTYCNLTSVFDVVSGIVQYKKFDNSEFEIAVGYDGATPRIYDISSPSSPSSIIGAVTFTVDKAIDFCTVADTLVITTEASDAPIKYTGGASCSALGGSPPSGKYCEEFFNYLFLANTLSNPERVYWSGVFAPESHTATDFKRMEAPVTGIVRQDNKLIIFTKYSMTVAQYTGDSLNPFTFDRLDTNIGCLSNQSIQNIEGTIYWMAADGHIYRMEGLQPERVTEAIPTTISNLVHGSLTKAVGIDHKELRQYWCAVSKDSTQNDFVIVIDYLNNEVFFNDGIAINCAANMSDSSGQLRTYFGDRNGYVYLTNNGNTDYPANVATDISYWRYTKPFDMGAPNLDKRFTKIGIANNAQGAYYSSIDAIVDFGRSTEQLEYSHDGGDYLWGTMVWGAFTWGNKSRITQKEDMAGTGKYLQLKFYHTGQEKPVDISDLAIEFRKYPRV